MSLIIGIYNSVKHTKEKIEDLKLLNEKINDVKYNKQVDLYRDQQYHYNSKGFYNGLGMAGSLGKAALSLGHPLVGNAIDPTLLVTYFSSYEDGYNSVTSGKIEQIRNLLEKVNSGKSQLENIEKTLLESTRRIIETLGRNYNTAPAA